MTVVFRILETQKNDMNKTAYFFLRMPVAMSLFGHGLVRLPKLQEFAEGMVNSMEESFLPEPLMLAFGYAIPFIEVITGFFLIIGLFTSETIYASIALMAILIFGCTTVENFGPITSQLVHSAYLAMLLYFIQFNGLSVDERFRTK